jgi:hypothetical protein
MKIKQTTISFVTMTLGVAFSAVAQTPSPGEVPRATAAFEELPVLNASDILRPDFLAGRLASAKLTLLGPRVRKQISFSECAH